MDPPTLPPLSTASPPKMKRQPSRRSMRAAAPFSSMQMNLSPGDLSTNPRKNSQLPSKSVEYVTLCAGSRLTSSYEAAEACERWELKLPGVAPPPAAAPAVHATWFESRWLV
jgi:hypothetical protein